MSMAYIMCTTNRVFHVEVLQVMTYDIILCSFAVLGINQLYQILSSVLLCLYMHIWVYDIHNVLCM